MRRILATGSAEKDAASRQAIALFSQFEPGLDTDPDSDFWSSAPSLFVSADSYGRTVPCHATEIRCAWSWKNLYFLFICPYLKLNLKPEPNTAKETNELWNWDVAEVFLGADFQNIRKYKEFEISPQGEWVDVDVDLDLPRPEDGWVWVSGCAMAARIDLSKQIWYGFMRIPYAAIDRRPAAAGNLLRANFFRCQGPEEDRKEIAWQPPHSLTFHRPEVFGTLKLIKP